MGSPFSDSHQIDHTVYLMGLDAAEEAEQAVGIRRSAAEEKRASKGLI
jgi:hypothetical protein